MQAGSGLKVTPESSDSRTLPPPHPHPPQPDCDLLLVHVWSGACVWPRQGEDTNLEDDEVMTCRIIDSFWGLINRSASSCGHLCDLFFVRDFLGLCKPSISTFLCEVVKVYFLRSSSGSFLLACLSELVSLLVGVLSPVNHCGLYLG